MGVKRKQHSAEFKARVAMASLSGEKTVAELSAEFGVHPTMISNWKQELVKRAAELFARGSKAPAAEVYPYLLRGKTIDRANQVWAADITYIPMRQGFLYLVAIIDWATRPVLS